MRSKPKWQWNIHCYSGLLWSRPRKVYRCSEGADWREKVACSLSPSAMNWPARRSLWSIQRFQRWVDSSMAPLRVMLYWADHQSNHLEGHSWHASYIAAQWVLEIVCSVLSQSAWLRRANKWRDARHSKSLWWSWVVAMGWWCVGKITTKTTLGHDFKQSASHNQRPAMNSRFLMNSSEKTFRYHIRTISFETWCKNIKGVCIDKGAIWRKK